jgi:hypothetical protein
MEIVMSFVKLTSYRLCAALGDLTGDPAVNNNCVLFIKCCPASIN